MTLLTRMASTPLTLLRNSGRLSLLCFQICGLMMTTSSDLQFAIWSVCMTLLLQVFTCGLDTASITTCRTKLLSSEALRNSPAVIRNPSLRRLPPLTSAFFTFVPFWLRRSKPNFFSSTEMTFQPVSLRIFFT